MENPARNRNASLGSDMNDRLDAHGQQTKYACDPDLDEADTETVARVFNPDKGGPADWATMYRSWGLQIVPAWSPTEQANWKQPRLAWKILQNELAPDQTFDSWYGPTGTHRTRE